MTQPIVPPHLGLRIRPGRDGRQEKQGIIRENKKGMEAWYRPGKPGSCIRHIRDGDDVTCYKVAFS